MLIVSDTKAVSTLMLIVLILCSTVFGGLISYLLVMSNFYNVPQPRVTVEDAVFPVSDATYFNVTILNPSNSASHVNITAIYLRVEGVNQVYNITDVEPYLPFSIRIGTEQTFKCEENWSNFTGEMVRIEPVASNAPITGQSFMTPKVELELRPNFDPAQSVRYFNLTIANLAESIINLTVSEIDLLGMPINENVTPTLPYTLSPNQTETFRCDWNWETYLTLKITVKTEEGYESSYLAEELPIAILYIDDIQFGHTDATVFDLVITNSEDSTSSATVTQIDLTLRDGRTVPINITNPPLGPISGVIPENQTKRFTCSWNWTEYRNSNVTVGAYTAEGFTIQDKTVETPPTVSWNITDTNLNLDYTGFFWVNVTNAPISLQDINVTKISINGDETLFEFQTIPIGQERSYNCTYDWKILRGENVNITIFTKAMQTDYESNSSKQVEVPSVALKLSNMTISETYIPDLNTTRPYINVTIQNSENSLQNVTISEIVLETNEQTYKIYGALTYPELPPPPDGYLLQIGEKLAVTWLWELQYIGPSMKLTVYTLEGIQVSETWTP